MNRHGRALIFPGCDAEVRSLISGKPVPKVAPVAMTMMRGHFF